MYLKCKGVKVGYSGFMVGKNGTPVKTRVEPSPDPDKTSVITADSSAAGGTEAYVLGVSNLSDMGDLSNKYLQKFVLQKPREVRLKTLKLGNSHKDYNNIYWGNEGSELEVSQFTLLEEFNLQNCPKFTKELSFKGCLAIRKILMTGSGATEVTLPYNSII
jgi:hypothetical protein